MDYSKFVFPIYFTSYNKGCGVIIDDLFITAGHVIEMGINPFISIKGEKYPLVKEEALYIDTNKKSCSIGYDVAIFRLKDISSPLRLADIIPAEGKKLLSCSYKHTSSGSGLSYQEHWNFEERLGEVVHLDDNYFECYFDSALKTGSSGSPIFDGEKVVGILYGDREGKESSNKVLFLSASAIMKLLKEIGYER